MIHPIRRGPRWAVLIGLASLGLAGAVLAARAGAVASAHSKMSAFAQPMSSTRAQAGAARLGTSAGALGFHLAGTWQSAPHPAPGGVLNPVDIAAAADGSVFVVDIGLKRVQRFDHDGELLGAFGVPDGAPEEGGLRAPFGIVLDEGRDRVYVSDRDAGRLSIFHLDGTPATTWEDYSQPEALAVGLEGRVYAYSRGAGAIVSRKADGGRDVNIPVPLAQAALALLPNGLAVDRAGMIWFASEAPSRTLPPVIWVFSPDGEVAPPRTQVRWVPRDIAIDSTTDRLYVLDGEGARLVTDFNRANAQHTYTPIAHNVRAIAAAGASRLELLDGPTGDSEGGVTTVRYDGTASTTEGGWGFPPIEPGWLSHPIRVAAGADGMVYVVDALQRAQRFDSQGRVHGYLRRMGLQEVDVLAGGDWLVARTRSSSSLDDPQDPDVAPPGKWRIRIERYRQAEGEARPTRIWARDWTEPVDGPSRTLLQAVAHDPARGRVYALDATGRKVLVLGLADGSPQAPLELPATTGVVGYQDLALDPDGRVLVLNTNARHITRLGAGGEPQGDIPMPPGTLRFAVGPDGRLVVVTAARDVQVLSADGQSLAAWPLPAPSLGEPSPASDVAVDAAGRIYVTDREGQAVHVFTPGEAPTPGKLWLPALSREG